MSDSLQHEQRLTGPTASAPPAVWRLGFRVYGLGFGLVGLGSRVARLGFGSWEWGFGGLWFVVCGLGCRV